MFQWRQSHGSSDSLTREHVIHRLRGQLGQPNIETNRVDFTACPGFELDEGAEKPTPVQAPRPEPEPATAVGIKPSYSFLSYANLFPAGGSR
jgi:hypothetical protein